MTTPTSRPGSGARGIDAVLDAAATVFARQGYDGCSIDDIADELRSTKGRVYHYYRSKEGLLAAVLHRGLERTLEAVRPIATDSERDPADRLYEMARAHARMIIEDHNYQRVLLRTLDVHTDSALTGSAAYHNAESLRALRREYEDLYVAVIEEGARGGSFADGEVRLSARAALGALNWLAVWYQPDRLPERKADATKLKNRIIEQLALFVARGVRAQ